MKIFLISFLSLITVTAHAYTQFVELEQNILSFTSALDESAPADSSLVWTWDVVRIRTVLEFGFEIPVVSKFSINPEVEFYFVKK